MYIDKYHINTKIFHTSKFQNQQIPKVRPILHIVMERHKSMHQPTHMHFRKSFNNKTLIVGTLNTKKKFFVFLTINEISLWLWIQIKKMD
jgi:hypothetical protein